jgi:DNA-binding beta-propeller fold protein YncE
MHAQNQHRSRHGLDPSGTHLYVANTTPTKSISGFSIGAGGILTSVGPDTVVSGATDLTNFVVDPSGTHIYVLDSGNGTTNGQVFGFSIGSGGVIGSTHFGDARCSRRSPYRWCRHRADRYASGGR